MLDEILIIIAAHSLLYFIGLRLTRRPIVTVFHLFLFVNTMGFVVRPILASLAGGHSLYMVFPNTWDLYKLGLMYQLLFNFTFVVSYIVVMGRYRIFARPIVSQLVQKGYVISVLVGICAIAGIHFLSKGAWLPSARSVSITAAVPGGKILFPMAVIPLSVSLPLGYLALVRSNAGLKSTSIMVGLGLVVLLLALLYQRGFVILGIVITVYLIERLAGLTYKRAMVAAVLGIIGLFVLRPFASVVSGTPISEAFGNDLIQKMWSFLLGPNFDLADVWPVTFAYVDTNGFVMGGSFLAIPGRFLSPELRLHLGLFTAVDRLNEFFWGAQYWVTRFGFNVNLAQEAYLNFGILGLILGLLPGAVTAWMDKKLCGLRRFNMLDVYFVAAAFMSGGFAGEIGGVVQWMAAYVAVGVAVSLCSRLSWHSIKLLRNNVSGR